MSAETGPHDLVVSYGDCNFSGMCSCGKSLGASIRPNESFDLFGGEWERHVMVDHRGCDCWSCQL